MSIDNVLVDIKAGNFDGDLTDILKAVNFRMSTGQVATRWKIDLDDLEVTEDDMTVGELEQIEKALGINWSQIQPLRSASTAGAMLRVFLQTRGDKSEEEADELVTAMRLDELLKAVERYEVVDPPLDQSEPST